MVTESQSSRKIRRATTQDRSAIEGIYHDAFEGDEGAIIAQLVADLLVDRTAEPLLSLVGEVDGRLAGHVLLTAASLEGCEEAASAYLLAPLAVATEQQGRGLGGALVREGLSQLASAGAGLVFVLGHPTYYPRFGFQPAGALGLDAPYPIAPKNAEAWMVHALKPNLLGKVHGVVRCAKAIDKPHFWIE